MRERMSEVTRFDSMVVVVGSWKKVLISRRLVLPATEENRRPLLRGFFGAARSFRCTDHQI